MRNIFAIIFLLFSPSLFAVNNIILVTEEYPPFNMIKNGEIIGISTEIMKAVLKKANINYTLELYPWARAFKMGLKDKNTAVFSTTRTPERENQFKWVGPLVANDWAFYAKKGSKIKISGLEDAKKYIVGGYNGDAVSEFLLKNGFILGKNIELTTKDRLNALKLKGGRIDLWATGTQLGPWLAKEEKSEDIIILHIFKKTEMYAAFNIKSDDNLIIKLNNIIKNMRKNGTIEKINKKYTK